MSTDVYTDRSSVVCSYYRFEIVSISRTQQAVIRETHGLSFYKLLVWEPHATSVNSKRLICDASSWHPPAHA